MKEYTWFLKTFKMISYFMSFAVFVPTYTGRCRRSNCRLGRKCGWRNSSHRNNSGHRGNCGHRNYCGHRGNCGHSGNCGLSSSCWWISSGGLRKCAGRSNRGRSNSGRRSNRGRSSNRGRRSKSGRGNNRGRSSNRGRGRNCCWTKKERQYKNVSTSNKSKIFGCSLFIIDLNSSIKVNFSK